MNSEVAHWLCQTGWQSFLTPDWNSITAVVLLPPKQNSVLSQWLKRRLGRIQGISYLTSHQAYTIKKQKSNYVAYALFGIKLQTVYGNNSPACHSWGKIFILTLSHQHAAQEIWAWCGIRHHNYILPPLRCLAIHLSSNPFPPHTIIILW